MPAWRTAFAVVTMLSLLAAESHATTVNCQPSSRLGYVYIGTEFTWHDGEAYCVSNLASHMASVANQKQQDIIGDVCRIRPGGTWISANDINTEGTFENSDGTPVTYTNWAPGEPNDDAAERCVETHDPDEGGWNDLSCTEHRAIICQLPTPDTCDADTDTNAATCGDSDNDTCDDCSQTTTWTRQPDVTSTFELTSAQQIDEFTSAQFYPNTVHRTFTDATNGSDGTNDVLMFSATDTSMNSESLTLLRVPLDLSPDLVEGDVITVTANVDGVQGSTHDCDFCVGVTDGENGVCLRFHDQDWLLVAQVNDNDSTLTAHTYPAEVHGFGVFPGNVDFMPLQASFTCVVGADLTCASYTISYANAYGEHGVLGPYPTDIDPTRGLQSFITLNEPDESFGLRGLAVFVTAPGIVMDPPSADPGNDGLDSDGDGLCDAGDTDDDNDGCLDVDEVESFVAGTDLLDHDFTSIADGANCPPDSQLFTIDSQDAFNAVQEWVQSQPDGLYYMNAVADGNMTGYMSTDGEFVASGVTHPSMEQQMADNINAECAESAYGDYRYDVLPFRGGVGFQSHGASINAGNVLYITCEDFHGAYPGYAVCGSSTRTAFSVDSDGDGTADDCDDDDDDDGCPDADDPLPRGGSIAVINEPLTYAEAEQVCQDRHGGHLVSIINEDENDRIGYLYHELDGDDRHDAWIGLNRVGGDSDDWTWTDGTESEYTYFAQNEPSGDGACVHLYTFDSTGAYGTRYSWNDGPCDQRITRALCWVPGASATDVDCDGAPDPAQAADPCALQFASLEQASAAADVQGSDHNGELIIIEMDAGQSPTDAVTAVLPPNAVTPLSAADLAAVDDACKVTAGADSLAISETDAVDVCGMTFEGAEFTGTIAYGLPLCDVATVFHQPLVVDVGAISRESDESLDVDIPVRGVESSLDAVLKVCELPLSWPMDVPEDNADAVTACIGGDGNGSDGATKTSVVVGDKFMAVLMRDELHGGPAPSAGMSTTVQCRTQCGDATNSVATANDVVLSVTPNEGGGATMKSRGVIASRSEVTSVPAGDGDDGGDGDGDGIVGGFIQCTCVCDYEFVVWEKSCPAYWCPDSGDDSGADGTGGQSLRRRLLGGATRANSGGGHGHGRVASTAATSTTTATATFTSNPFYVCPSGPSDCDAAALEKHLREPENANGASNAGPPGTPGNMDNHELRGQSHGDTTGGQSHGDTTGGSPWDIGLGIVLGVAGTVVLGLGLYATCRALKRTPHTVATEKQVADIAAAAMVVVRLERTDGDTEG